MPTAKIWVDADACPVAVKEILFRAAERTQVETTLVANHFMQVPRSAVIKFIKVASGFDVADHVIVQQAQPGDLVVTQDIPLAAEVIEKGAEALHPRGEPYSPDTIRQRLNMRDFMETMRASGVQTGGPPPLGQSEKQAFANALDRWLAKARR